MIEPLAVDLLLLRSLLTPEIRIAPGRAIMARVVSTAEASGKGALSIAGVVIDADLPKSVRAGQDIRLVVKEVSAERVVLTLSDPAAVAPPPVAVELPGGGKIRLTEREESEHGASGSPSDAHTINLRYDAPTLGAVDLRLDLDAGSLRVAIALPHGEPVTLAQGASDDLREELAADGGRSVSVTVSARREPLDVYA